MKNMNKGNGITTKQLENILEKFHKKNQKDLKETRNQFTVVLEEMRGDIQAVAEGVSIVQKDLDEFKKETKDNFKAVDENFKAVFDWQSNFSDSFDEEFALMREELEDIKKELKKRPTGKEFNLLESRLTSLEHKFDDYEKAHV